MSQPSTPSRPVTSAEIASAFTVPAVASDRFFVSNTPNRVRIAFAETMPGTETSVTRAAVMLTPEDAAALAQLLMAVLSNPIPAPGPVPAGTLAH